MSDEVIPDDVAGDAIWAQLLPSALPWLLRVEQHEVHSLVDLMRQHAIKVRMNGHARFEMMSSINDVHMRQRDAYHRFLVTLLAEGVAHDPEFFEPYADAFKKLKQGMYTEVALDVATKS